MGEYRGHMTLVFDFGRCERRKKTSRPENQDLFEDCLCQSSLCDSTSEKTFLPHFYELQRECYRYASDYLQTRDDTQKNRKGEMEGSWKAWSSGLEQSEGIVVT